MQITSVSELTTRVKAAIDSDAELSDIWVEGEISNFHRASSGHCYYTLKDSESEVRCVMWRQQAARLAWIPGQGDWADAHGYVSVYERGGVYQFYTDALQESGGIGDRWRQFLELKTRLEAEGLFDPERKRPLPEWPRRIGVVTSATGAAYRDILNVLRARYPLVEVILSPSRVQGLEAPASIVDALDRLKALGDLDVVIIGRGGGSVEDLWAFNDERVARAVLSSGAPVISGVGHETDFTIIDFVADLRAPTPSAAAAAAVPDARELRHQILGDVERLNGLAEELLARRRTELGQRERLVRLYEPLRLIAERRQRVDDMVHRLGTRARDVLANRAAGVESYRATLNALAPRHVMERGYAIVRASDTGDIVQSIGQADVGMSLDIHVTDGGMAAEVTDIGLGGSTG